MKIHFVGIGGIGVSALAQYFLSKGNKVSGSDLASSETIKLLEKKGAKISIGKHKKKNLPKDTNLVIYSPAIEEKNPELKEAKENKIEIKSYPQALGDLTKKYYTIAVSGTHGKSTTSALLGLILAEAGLDPTVILGTKLKEFGGSNFRKGKSKYLVIEADEWKASFLNYYPKVIVLTNIEKEHLDYYKNLNHILKTFKEFVSHLPQNGILIANKKDKNILKLLSDLREFSFKIKKYPKNKEEIKKIKKVLNVPGEHNAYNAAAALKVAESLEIKKDKTFRALSHYKGAWRRFEIKEKEINTKKVKVISDYAHHPTEIEATISACREKFPNSRIWVIFQPHQYQRTFYLFDDFVEAFNEADKIILTKIYTVAGREKEDISKKVSSKKLTEEIKKKGKDCYFIEDFSKIPLFLIKKIKENDVIIVMGAGSIYKLTEKL